MQQHGGAEQRLRGSALAATRAALILYHDALA